MVHSTNLKVRLLPKESRHKQATEWLEGGVFFSNSRYCIQHHKDAQGLYFLEGELSNEKQTN